MDSLSAQKQALQQKLEYWLQQLQHSQPDASLFASSDWYVLLHEIQEHFPHEQDRSYRIFFEKAKTPQLLIDPQTGLIVQANPAAALFYGYSQAELAQMRISDINCLTPEQIRIEMACAEAEQRCFFHFPHRLANGDIRQVEVYSGPLQLGEQVLLYSIIYDLTERLNTEAKLRRRRQRLQSIIAATQAGTWEWHLSSNRILINAYWAKLLGYQRDDLLPFTQECWQSLCHPDDWLIIRHLFAEHQAGRLPYLECELRMRHRLGHWVWILCRGRIMTKNADGEPVLMAGTHQDISARKTAELALRDSEGRYRALHDSLPLGCLLLDRNLAILAVNQEACRIFSQTPEALVGCQLKGAHWQRLREDGLPLPLEEHPVTLCFRGVAVRNAVMGIKPPEQPILWIRVNCQPLRHNEGAAPYAVIATLQDMTAERKAQEELQLAASVFTAAREAILITDASGTIMKVNQAFCEMTGYRPDQVIGQNPRMLHSGYQDLAFYQSFWLELITHGHWTGELWNRRSNGEVFAAQMTISAVRDTQGITRHYVCLASDISDRKQYQRQLEQQAYHDLLTGLPNRKRLFDQLPGLMAQCRQDPQRRLALAFIDLDGFKQINDQYGHALGDELLITVTRRMRMMLREEDLLVRIGGDEFILVLQGQNQRTGLLRIIQRLLRAIAQPVFIDQVRMQVSASIGLTGYPQAMPLSAEALIQQADEAMYRVKQQGKNGFLVADDANMGPDTTPDPTMFSPP